MKVDLNAALADVTAHWRPLRVAGYNGNDVMVVKVKGAFPFHLHEDSDDFFLVLKGEILMDIEDGPTETLRAGDLFVVPAGVTHRPRAPEEAEILLIEPAGLVATNEPQRREIGAR
ncbi:cupin domain-containing protein [Jannaschia ovalis]|uniref:Cupin domain-containing protein n=1 Tax=Jannaschia ovalis TaxID=3038773 RepID=A0ABY8LEV1_9RHOB|nr:cupin domain-containing protein [Jannaschia sp. GRR-S6-38]WGH79696.1 cupin domain-containing protein [Jannaschia sp. GRR-S6-38]